MADLLAGHTAFMFDSLNTALPQIRAGKLRALAVTGPKRSPLLPDVPTMAEAGVPGYNITARFGIHVQGKTPAAIVQRLNKELVAIAHAPDLRQRFAEQGVDRCPAAPPTTPPSSTRKTASGPPSSSRPTSPSTDAEARQGRRGGSAPPPSVSNTTFRRHATPSALHGLRVLDLTRVLAGPSVHPEPRRPRRRRDQDRTSRARRRHARLGPALPARRAGEDTSEAAYYLSMNRNKRSVALDFTTESGRARCARWRRPATSWWRTTRSAARQVRHGLREPARAQPAPDLLLDHGFRPTAYAARPGYDFMIQGMGGLMSITGERDDLPGGGPQKAGVAVVDVMTGMYATVAIPPPCWSASAAARAAARHRPARLRGRHAGQPAAQLPDFRPGAAPCRQRPPERGALPVPPPATGT